MLVFLLALIELFFAIDYGSGVIRRNVYRSAVFTGGGPPCTQRFLDRVAPINHSGYHKTRATGLPDDEDRILLRSLILTQ